MLGPGQGGGRVRLILDFVLEENATFKGKTFPIGWGGGVCGHDQDLICT